MSDYALLRPSLPADEGELKALWREVFGDTDELIDAFFELIYSPGDAVVALREGRVVSAGYCLSGAMAEGLRCSYIYAMATYPGHRGRGLGAAVARLLTERAFESGADVVATLPADESLRQWYEKVLGMTPAFIKGGEGVSFPGSWRQFAKITGPHSPDSPPTLHAVPKPGVDMDRVKDLGWECCWD